jgi:hypothetical protein
LIEFGALLLVVDPVLFEAFVHLAYSTAGFAAKGPADVNPAFSANISVGIYSLYFLRDRLREPSACGRNGHGWRWSGCCRWRP